MTRNDDEHSILIDNFINLYVLLFDSTSKQGASKIFLHPDLVAHPARLEVIFTLPPERVSELSILGEQMSSAAADKFGVDGRSI